MGAEKMRLVVLACILAVASASFKWDSCGTKNDRLKTTKVSVDGAFAAGSKVTVTASGNTDLHVPLTTGAWQVRIYELGVSKSTHSEVGDLMKALKFDDPKNTTFTVTVSFTLPAKQASGTFTANLVATDQAKADYMCLDVKYSYAKLMSAADFLDDYCLHHIDDEDHKCFEACATTKFASKGITDGGACPSSYNTVDKTQVVEQCSDGTTSLRYCTGSLYPVNVTMKRKGEEGAALMADVLDDYCLHHIDDEDHKCFEACASQKFASKGITDGGACPS